MVTDHHSPFFTIANARNKPPRAIVTAKNPCGGSLLSGGKIITLSFILTPLRRIDKQPLSKQKQGVNSKMSKSSTKSFEQLYKHFDHMTGMRAYQFVHELVRKCKKKSKAADGREFKPSINALCRDAEVSRHTVYAWRNKPDTVPDVAILMRLVDAARAKGARI
jgi:hypothetical protein